MARIFLVSSSLAGTLYPAVELARRLASSGHRLTLACLEDARAIVERNGIDFLPLEPSRYEEFLAADARRSALSRLLDLRSRRQEAKKALAVGDFAATIRRLDPDLVLVNGEMHEHIIAGSASGVPIVLLNSFVSIWRRPGLPPPHSTARPGIGWTGSRVGMFLLWKALRLKKLYRAGRLAVRRVGCDRLSLLRQLAADAGFGYREATDATQWLVPFTYRRFPVLSLHALEFEFPHRPPEHVRYVGPMVLADRGDQRTHGADEAALERVVAGCGEGGRPLVYAAFGSLFSTDLDFLRRLIAAVAEHTEGELVISLAGATVGSGELGPLPERVHAFEWLPQLEVLEHADVAVIHGGINTVDECVLHGVPMLVYCGFETDMGGTTARVVHHGIGVAGDRRRDGPRTIAEKIEHLLHEPRYRRAVEKLRARYLAYVENRVAERAVESMLPGAATGPLPRRVPRDGQRQH